MLDMSRLVALAPQWVESMVRTEAKGAGQLAKGLTYDPIVHRSVLVGSLGKGVAQGLLAYVVGTQILNLFTRGQFTWQNQEPGHKFDAWIPDVTGKSPGFFLSPLSVVAEVTHDLIRYAHSEPTMLDAAVRIASNKTSPLWRAGQTLVTGKTMSRDKLIGTWDRAKAAAIALAPTPIPLSTFVRGSDYPGQTQRQITASLGVKTEPAPTPHNEIRQLYSSWMSRQTDPRLKHEFERREKEEFGQSDYRDLRNDLYQGNLRAAKEDWRKLMKIKGGGSKAARIINEAMDPKTEAGTPKPLISGRHADEMKFFRSLSPEQQQVYRHAMAERQKMYARFRQMLSRP